MAAQQTVPRLPRPAEQRPRHMLLFLGGGVAGGMHARAPERNVVEVDSCARFFSFDSLRVLCLPCDPPDVLTRSTCCCRHIPQTLRRQDLTLHFCCSPSHPPTRGRCWTRTSTWTGRVTSTFWNRVSLRSGEGSASGQIACPVRGE